VTPNPAVEARLRRWDAVQFSSAWRTKKRREDLAPVFHFSVRFFNAIPVADRAFDGLAQSRFAHRLLPITVVRQLLNIVHQAEQLPLRVDLLLPAHRVLALQGCRWPASFARRGRQRLSAHGERNRLAARRHLAC
jgi:hypothetical protein